MITQGYRQYQTMQAQTADRGELVIMLYQGAIKFLSRASSCFEAGKLEEGHTNLIRAQDIIVELMCTLDVETGSVAVNLMRLYEYMHYRLVHANIHKESEPIEEVASLMRQLLTAWQTAVQTNRAQNGASDAVLRRDLRLAPVQS